MCAEKVGKIIAIVGLLCNLVSLCSVSAASNTTQLSRETCQQKAASAEMETDLRKKLYKAIEEGDLGETKQACDNLHGMNWDPCYSPKELFQPLCYAANHDCPEIFDHLVARGATPDPSALYPAVGRGNYEMFKRVLSHCSSSTDGKKNLIDSISRTCLLHHAAKCHQDEMVKDLLAIHGVEVDRRNKQHLTPLHIAAFAGANKVVRLLLAAGADVNDSAPQTGEDGRLETVTPLAAAAMAARPTTVDLLIKAGATIDPRDSKGRTPLYNALKQAAFTGDRGFQSLVLEIDNPDCFTTDFANVAIRLFEAGAAVDEDTQKLLYKLKRSFCALSNRDPKKA